MNSFCHIEIPVKDMNRAKDFYEGLFDWRIVISPDNHYATFTGGGFRRAQTIQSGGITPFLQVDNLTNYTNLVEKLGGKILVARETAGDCGFCAFFQDPEGNVLGLFEKRQRK